MVARRRIAYSNFFPFPSIPHSTQSGESNRLAGTLQLYEGVAITHFPNCVAWSRTAFSEYMNPWRKLVSPRFVRRITDIVVLLRRSYLFEDPPPLRMFLIISCAANRRWALCIVERFPDSYVMVAVEENRGFECIEEVNSHGHVVDDIPNVVL